jgi:hypothetical protein
MYWSYDLVADIHQERIINMNDPNDQVDTKTPIEKVEEYLINQARHKASLVSKSLIVNDLSRAVREQTILNSHIKTLNWMISKGYASKWEKTSGPKYIDKVAEDSSNGRR